MQSSGILNISEVNALPFEKFQCVFGNVIEHCSEAARHVETMRPFTSRKALEEAFEDYLDKLDNTGKENVLVKHPDLAGKLSNVSLTAESTQEQKSAGIELMSQQQKQTLNSYNDLYREKFNFPFVICARENNVETILKAIQARLSNPRDSELHLGIKEVKKICNIRINDLVWPDV